MSYEAVRFGYDTQNSVRILCAANWVKKIVKVFPFCFLACLLFFWRKFQWLKKFIYLKYQTNSIVEKLPKFHEGILIIRGKRMYFMFFFLYLYFEHLFENYHIFEVGFKTPIKATGHHTTPPAATVGGN